MRAQCNKRPLSSSLVGHRPARAADLVCAPGGLSSRKRITLELETDDVARFHDALRRAERLAREMDECDVVDAAKQALDTLPISTAPGFVRKRLGEVQRLLVMLEDEAWALRGPERMDVLRALVYFSDPED